MANNKEEAGKGTPRPGEAPGSKRTYATIDLTASEVERQGQAARGGCRHRRRPTSAASAAEARSAGEAGGQARPSLQAKSAGPGAARLSDGGNAGAAGVDRQRARWRLRGSRIWRPAHWVPSSC